MMTWKIVGISKVSVLYIYIDYVPKKVKQKLKEGESRLVMENLKNQTHYQILYKIHQPKAMLQKIINK